MSKKTLLALALLLASGSALATFDGRFMEGPYYFPNLSSEISRDSWTVGPGLEYSGFPSADTRTDLDISSNNIRFEYTSSSSWTQADYNGPVLLLCSAGPVIDTVTVNGETNMAGFDISRVSWDATSVSVNWNSLPFDINTVVSLDVTFADDRWPGSLCNAEPPEPVPSMNVVGLTLMLGLLALFGLYRARRHNA